MTPLQPMPSVSQHVHFSCFIDHLSDGNEWNPDIISGVVRPPEQIKLVHGMEAIRSVSSSSSSSGKHCFSCLQLLYLLCRVSDIIKNWIIG